MNTRYYLVRTAANVVAPEKVGYVDSGYADGSHQIQFGSLADMMRYAATNGELVFEVSSPEEATQILQMYASTKTAPAGVAPTTGLALTLMTLPWYAWLGIGYAVYRLL